MNYNFIRNVSLIFTLLFGSATAADFVSNALQQSRFSMYEPNYMLALYSRENDDLSMAGKVSMKYMISDCFYTMQANEDIKKEDAPVCYFFSRRGWYIQWFFSYTTEFDFYLWDEVGPKLRREGKPVIGRGFKPGISLRLKTSEFNNYFGDDGHLEINYIQSSFMHHSNGAPWNEDALVLPGETGEQAADRLDAEFPSWRDSISRGWWYWEYKANMFMSLSNTTRHCHLSVSCFEFTPRLRLQTALFDVEDDIWWEPNNSSQKKDYEFWGFNLKNETEVNIQLLDKVPFFRYIKINGVELAVDVDAGINLNNFSYEPSLTVNLGFNQARLPFFIYSHIGPNEHWYNYHEDVTSAGFGFQFKY